MIGICGNYLTSGWLYILARIFSLPGDSWYPVVIVLAVGLVFFYNKKLLWGSVIILAPLLGSILKTVLKNYFEVPRPADFGCISSGTYGDIYSFPSGHTVFGIIFFGLLAYYCFRKKSHVLFFLCVFIVLGTGFSRVYLGAHWVLDVIGGYALGGAVLVVSMLIIRRFEKSDKNNIAHSSQTYENHQVQGKNRRNKHREHDQDGYILKAGSIIVKGDKALVLYRGSHGDFSLPKGHVESGETLAQALAREVLEETGLIVEIIKELPDFTYEYPEGDGKVRIKMFLTEPVSGGLTPEHRGDKLLWVDINDLARKLTYSSLNVYVTDNLEEIKK